MSAEVTGWSSGPVERLLGDQQVHGVLIGASRDPDAKLTFVVTAGRDPGRLVVKVPTTAAAGEAVDREGRMLVEVRRLGLGALAATVPRYVGSLGVGDLPVLVSTAVPGTPMSIGYHQWTHTRRPGAVRGDFSASLDWLAGFQAVTTRGNGQVDWPQQVLETVAGRWDGHAALGEALVRLETARDHLASAYCARTAVHGDFWFGNLLVTGGSVTGVVDWESAVPSGSPLRDLARFVLSYALYLDRHTAPGRRVPGHHGLVRAGIAPGVRHALCGPGWFPDVVREALQDRLEQLELDPRLWYDVALTGIGEVAAGANSADFGADHLQLLTTLPVRARRHRRSSR